MVSALSAVVRVNLSDIINDRRSSGCASVSWFASSNSAPRLLRSVETLGLSFMASVPSLITVILSQRRFASSKYGFTLI